MPIPIPQEAPEPGVVLPIENGPPENDSSEAPRAEPGATAAGEAATREPEREPERDPEAVITEARPQNDEAHAQPNLNASSTDAPGAFPFPTAEKHDPLPQEEKPLTQEPSESALDHGVEESFPASDPVSVTVSKVVSPPAEPETPRHSLPPALRTGLIAGAGASLLSTAALMLAGRTATGSFFAPTNATSHWLWGEEAFRADRPTWRHTGAGYLTHHLAATFWATLFAWAFERKGSKGDEEPTYSAPETLAGATATAAASYLIDYTITPERLRPGYEHRLPKTAVYLVYGALAIGLAAGFRLAHRR